MRGWFIPAARFFWRGDILSQKGRHEAYELPRAGKKRSQIL
jgi:hypothetical protein